MYLTETSKKVLLLFIVSALIYLPFLRNQLVWDDEQFIYNNAYVREFRVGKLLTENTIAGAGEQSNYYRPLTSISLALDYQFWQTNPIGYHLTNLLLHTAAGLLLFRLLIELGLSKRAAFWISAAFLAHPVQTEAVTYANSRGDSMYTLFGMLSLLSFTWLLQRGKIQAQVYNLSISAGPTFFAVATFLSYLAAILGKEIGIAVVGLHGLILVRWLLLNKRKSIPGIAILVGLIATAAGYLALRGTLLNFANSFNFYADSTSLYAQSLFVRLLTFSKIIWMYLQVLLIPYPLHMERDTTLVTSLLSPWPWLTLGLAGCILFAGWLECRRLKTVWIWFGALWAAVMLAPVSGVIPINGLLYEHWLYTPLIGVCLAVYGGLRLSKLRPPLWLGVLLLTVWILLSWRQNYIWSTPERLYTHILKYAETGRIRNNLAMAYAEEGKHDLAIQEYQAALTISDHYPQIYYNLANTYVAQKNWELAALNYQKALELNPRFEPAYPRLALVLIEQKDWEAAENVLAEWQTAVGSSESHTTLKTHLETLRKTTE